jgi:hypothetical protein
LTMYQRKLRTQTPACPVGKYRTSVTDTVCATCPAGTYSDPGQDSCSDCPKGSFCLGGASFVTVGTPGRSNATVATSRTSQTGLTVTDPCTSAGLHEIISESDCQRAVENDQFVSHPSAPWGGIVDYKDSACTTQMVPHTYMDKPCPFEDSKPWSQPTGCEYCPAKTPTSAHLLVLVLVYNSSRNLICFAASPTTAGFIYLREDTSIFHHYLGKVVWGQGYDGDPEPLQPQICLTSRQRM